MKLEKAIRRLQSYIRWRKPDPNDNFHESVQLGIEAMKRIKQDRRVNDDLNPYSLPGETKD